MAQDPDTKAVVPLKVLDGKMVSSPSRNTHRSQLGSDYSLFELETFFTRWAPDSESASARDGPSCSFAPGDSPDCVQESQPQRDSASPVLTVNERLRQETPSFSSAFHIRPSGSQGSRCHHICAVIVPCPLSTFTPGLGRICYSNIRNI